MKKESIIPLWVHNSRTRLAVLAASHFMADMLGGTLPGILPAALVYFHLNLGWGVVILTCMSIGCNIMQIPASMLDRHCRSPRLLAAGLLMAGMIALLACLPDTAPFALICILMVVAGAGIAIVHPLGLRGTQRITDISPGITTPAFMTSGFLGSAVGPWISAVLVSSCFGMRGLFFLLIPLAAVIIMLRLANVKLALDNQKTSTVKNSAGTIASPWSFRRLLLAGFLMNTGTALLQNLLPLRLVELGMTLSFGGMSAMLFGAGSAIGSMTLGVLLRKKSPGRLLPWTFVLGIPVLLAYLLLMPYRISCVLVCFAGMLCSSAFPLFVALARTAPGTIQLSSRMALIVGGTWGCAGIMLLPFGQLAQHIGLAPVMHLSWCFYLLAFLTVREPYWVSSGCATAP